MNNSATILVTGATGYVGGRLVPRLLEEGRRVRCLVRDASRLRGRSWANRVELVEGDFLKPDTLLKAMDGVEAVYYLIHSMRQGSQFEDSDLEAASNCADAARKAGVQRIIYLGGLGDPSSELSPHLRSRQKTGEALGRSGVPVTEFRAAVIVGSGSISFEMIRYLSERLPVMICPRWVYTRIQPISIRNVLDYLARALEVPESRGRIIEIGGSEVLTYAEMMTGYAAVRGLKRWLVPVPVLTPRLSSYWVHLVTPIPSYLAQPLVKGLRNEVIVQSPDAQKLFPDVHLLDYRESVERALDRLRKGDLETIWSDALTSSQGTREPVSLIDSQGMILEQRRKEISIPAEQAYRSFASIGGKTGWLYMDWAWKIRGMVDRLFGGVGMRRGRRDPVDLRPGDALDFWRVEEVQPGRMIRLRAEMKVPGRAWLSFEAKPEGDGRTSLIQTAFFEPKGLSGLAYWYLLYPIHSLIFSGLIKQLAKRASASSPPGNG